MMDLHVVSTVLYLTACRNNDFAAAPGQAFGKCLTYNETMDSCLLDSVTLVRSIG